jgi:hypothetical protein
MLSPPPPTPRDRRKPSTTARFTNLAALFVSAADRAMFLLLLHGRRCYQVQNVAKPSLAGKSYLPYLNILKHYQMPRS